MRQHNPRHLTPSSLKISSFLCTEGTINSFKIPSSIMFSSKVWNLASKWSKAISPGHSHCWPFQALVDREKDIVNLSGQGGLSALESYLLVFVAAQIVFLQNFDLLRTVNYWDWEWKADGPSLTGSTVASSLSSEWRSSWTVSTTNRIRSRSVAESSLNTSRQGAINLSGRVSCRSIPPIELNLRSIKARQSYLRTRSNIFRRPISSA
jgi:hypothetical protein